MFSGDDVAITSGGDKDVRAGGNILHSGNFKADHCSLESIDGVNLGDNDASSVVAKGFSTLVVVNMKNGNDLTDQPTPLPTSPKPATTATLPANMTSVARLIPSTRDSRQP